MQQAQPSPTIVHKHVAKLSLYITPEGELAMVSGNQFMLVSSQEAQEHVAHFLDHAELFRRHIQAPITGQTWPASSGLVPAHTGVPA